MSEIEGVEVAERLPEPESGHAYRIVNVEYVKTPVRGLEGWRVTLLDLADNSKHSTVLWKRERVGPYSKLGAFLKAFKDLFNDEEKARNTLLWIDKVIEVISWEAKRREVKVKGAPAKPAEQPRLQPASAEPIEECVRQMLEKLEKGRAYTLSDIKAVGVDFPDDVIEEALKKLEGLGKAYPLPTRPAKWFVEG